MDNRKYDLIGIGYSMQCPNTRQFNNRVHAIIRRDKSENASHIDCGFKMFGHEFAFHGNKYMIDYKYHDFGYQANVRPCS